MPGRTRLTVAYDKKEGSWSVKGGEGVSSYRATTEAVSEAARMGRQNGNAQVVIKNQNGRIQSERTYGNDPRRSKG